MFDPIENKCENGNCKGKGAIYERNGMIMCKKCIREYDTRVHGASKTYDDEDEP